VNSSQIQLVTARRLLRSGVLLVLLGLVTGLVVPVVSNPRMGLSSHLEGVMNGTFLVVLGLLWPKLRLSDRSLVTTFWLAIYSTYLNWATTLAAAVWGAGGSRMPIAAFGRKGTPLQETLVSLGLVSLAVGMLATCMIVLWGLRGADPNTSNDMG
jgi:(hydroxyamino)benzene mutase